MNKSLGIGLLVTGMVLIILGIHASESFGSEIARFFNGTPTDKAIWLLLAGVLCEVSGLFLTVGRSIRP